MSNYFNYIRYSLLLVMALMSVGISKAGDHYQTDYYKKIKKVEVYQVPFFVRTPKMVSCENFMSYFKARIDSFEITNTDDQRKIFEDLFSSQPAMGIDSIDTRAKVYIFYASGSVDTICLGATPVYMYKGKYMLSTKGLITHMIYK